MGIKFPTHVCKLVKLEYYTAQYIKTVENSHKNIFQRKIYRNEQRICY